MKTGAKLAILESAFFFLLASIIIFALIGWAQLALLLSAVIAVAGRLTLDYYYECLAECGSLSAMISMMPIIILIALTLTMISLRQHPFLTAALYTLLFVIVIWKIAMLLRWTGRGKEGQS